MHPSLRSIDHYSLEGIDVRRSAESIVKKSIRNFKLAGISSVKFDKAYVLL